MIFFETLPNLGVILKFSHATTFNSQSGVEPTPSLPSRTNEEYWEGAREVHAYFPFHVQCLHSFLLNLSLNTPPLYWYFIK